MINRTAERDESRSAAGKREESLTDQEFINAFEQGNLTDFRHADHIRMAWIYFTRSEPSEAFQQVISGIKRFADAKNSPGMYHETITLFWLFVVYTAVTESRCDNFSEFLSRNAQLFQKDYLFAYYSRDLVMSDHARAVWVEPDLQPLVHPFSTSIDGM